MFLQILKANLKNFAFNGARPIRDGSTNDCHSTAERDALRQRICVAYRVPPAEAELQIEAAIQRQHLFKPAKVRL